MALFPIEPLTACALTLACLGGPTHPPASELTLTLQGAYDGAQRSVTLECQPPGGSHPDSREACTVLAKTQGDFGKLDEHEKRQMCTLELAPVQATASGHWRGEPVEFADTYPNRCAADAFSGGVFGF